MVEGARFRCEKIRGLETQWWEAGPACGPILFFIHGFPDHAGVWREQVAHFAKTNRVIAPILRGAEDGPSTDLQLERFETDSVALDHLEILRLQNDLAPNAEVMVIGHDIGGIHAWTLSRLLADRLSGLVVVNAPELGQMARRLRNPRQAARSWYFGLFMIPRISEFLLDRYGPEMFKGLRARATLPSAMLGHYRAAIRSGIAHPLKRLVAGAEPRLRAPVLVLWGKDDPYLLPPTQDEVDAIADSASIRILPGGHWLQHEMPERLNQFIAELLPEREAEVAL